METARFDYDLPERAIAQDPVEPRDRARLLVDQGPGRPPAHRTVADLPGYVGPGDLVVLNRTRVLRARLRLHKPTGGAVEVLLLEPTGDAGPEAQLWQALVRPSRKVPPGTELVAGLELRVVIGDVLDGGRREVRVLAEDVPAALERHGELPLPPYIRDAPSDPERYQTVYAEEPGSVAAPTAGLHLTEQVLADVEASGARVAAVDLRVGIGTFRPITSDDVADHVMHEERYDVPAKTWEACRAAERVVAVGTTTVRALESVAATGRLTGRTDLYLRPGDDFGVVDVLLTNFHLPRSSLLVLVEAFVGPRWRELYGVALEQGYRFLSFGDAMLVSRHGGIDERSPRRGSA